MTNVNAGQYRPFAKIASATLVNVTNRGLYKRFGKEFEDALQTEMDLRGLMKSERRTN